MDNKKGEKVSGILFVENIGKAAVISLLLLAATTFVASADCEHNVSVTGWCCDDVTYDTAGWFYNETTPGWENWNPAGLGSVGIALFQLNVSGDAYNAYCINFEVLINIGDIYNASKYTATPSCKNNSIAYILNNWTHACAPHCANVSAGQSAVWYFWYINDTVPNGFCSLGDPKYNHTTTPTDPGWESNWIPNCSFHQEACNFINASINKSVPYNITTSPSSGSYPRGTPIELEATVGYCAGENATEVTVVFKADDAACTFNGGTNVYENVTSGGKLNTTLTCGVGVDSVNFIARVKDKRWFEIVDPDACQVGEYQETLALVNITDEGNFSFLDLGADIGINKLVDGVKKREVAHNQTVTYTLNITNTGEVNLTNIMVVDTLPADVTWADAANPVQDSVTNNADGTTTIVWKNNITAYPFKPGDSFEIKFNATVNEDAETHKIHRNWAEVNATSEWDGSAVGPKRSYADVFLECHKVPLLMPFGIAALIGLLSLVVILSIRKSVRKKKG